MHFWPEKRNPRRGKDKKTYDRIGGKRWLEPTNDVSTGTTNPLARKFTSFTPLTAPIDQVLMQIKDEGALTFLGKLKGDPNKGCKDKYCYFHRDHGHDTTDCYDLKQQIEAFIKQGKLQRFDNREKEDPSQDQAPRRDNEHPRPPLGKIRMIMGSTVTTGSSKKARKTYLRMVQNVQLTGFVPKMA